MGVTWVKSARSLGERFIAAAKRNWPKRCISDSTGKRLTYGQALVKAVALAAEIKKLVPGQGATQERVGILLPPSVGGALANLAVTLSGKVTVNLNYAASEQARGSAVEQCGIKCIISSGTFVKRTAGADKLGGVVFLEDIARKIGFVSRLKAYLKARLLPSQFLTGHLSGGDELATIIFSSGSTGGPKGVMLSHNNILSNIKAVTQVFKLQSGDNICGVLPFFHCFGFTCSLWLPVVSGISASSVANPLDGETIGRIARQRQSTILFAAPTFLLNYVRRAGQKDFASLRAVVVGAEKLRGRLADLFEDRFGIRPLEGYGATELSPVVALNMPTHLSTGLCRVGVKEGTAGRVIPKIQVKVVCPWSRKELAAGAEGLLMVKGPNVMLGYLDKKKETADVLADGWYNTGDIGSIDGDGFLTITGRLSRFSKIGGEMVPHPGVEQAYMKGLGTDEQVVVVTSVPEPKKGEELVVLYLDKAGSTDRLRKIISQSNLPNMWKPRQDNYIKIDSIPALGSGKLDIVRLREIALTAKGGSIGR